MGTTPAKPGDEGTASLEAGAASSKRQLTPAAERALAEAEERRARLREQQPGAPRELGGREGPDPARYGDWENNGIVSDF